MTKLIWHCLLINKYDNDSTVSKFVAKKRIEITDLSEGQYKKIKFKTSMLRLDLRDFSDAYMVVRGIISLTDTNANNRRDKTLTIKTNALFR